MTTYELLAELRNLLGDTLTSPQFWTDAELMRYLSEAYDDACTRAELIKDKSTADIVSISVTANDPDYTLHEKVLRVDRAMWYTETEVDATYSGSEVISDPGTELVLTMLNSTTGVLLKLKNRYQLDQIYSLWETETYPSPTYFITEADHEFVLSPTPTQNGLVVMVVTRLPLWPLATAFTRTDVDFNTTTHRITTGAAGLVALGYEVGMTINVSGSTDNDGDYTITTVADTDFVVEEDLVTESSGDTVIVSSSPQDIDAHYHYPLLYGALSRAYLKGTNNCFNLPLSQNFDNEFARIFGTKRSAVMEKAGRSTPLEGGAFAHRHFI